MTYLGPYSWQGVELRFEPNTFDYMVHTLNLYRHWTILLTLSVSKPVLKLSVTELSFLGHLYPDPRTLVFISYFYSL